METGASRGEPMPNPGALKGWHGPVLSHNSIFVKWHLKSQCHLVIWCSPTPPPPLEHTGFPWYLLVGIALDCGCCSQRLSPTQMQRGRPYFLEAEPIPLFHVHTSERKRWRQNTKTTRYCAYLKYMGLVCPQTKLRVKVYRLSEITFDWCTSVHLSHYFRLNCVFSFICWSPVLQTVTAVWREDGRWWN